MLRKALCALALTAVAFTASAASVSVVNKVVTIQFINGKTVIKDYTPFCSTGIGVQTFSSNVNGQLVESVNVNCVTVTQIPNPPFIQINSRLIETVRDR